MRGITAWLALVTLLGTVPALGQVAVSSYKTVAETNAYAPLSQDQYFQQQTLTNTSPAIADVAADWTGTNRNGTTTTWHFTGASHTETTTTVANDRIRIVGAGSFSYDLLTTADFVDPGGGSFYRPGGTADYECSFQTFASGRYTLSVQLGRWGHVHLGSVEYGTLFDQFNAGVTPVLVDSSAVLPDGHYFFQVNSGLAAPNLPPGVNHYPASGSFTGLDLLIQAPEPEAFRYAGLAAAAMLTARSRMRRSWS
jgi:hypothetical protein